MKSVFILSVLLVGCGGAVAADPDAGVADDCFVAAQQACTNCCNGRMRCTCAGLHDQDSCPEVTDDACLSTCIADTMSVCGDK